MSDEAIVVGARDEATAILRKVQEQTQSLATGVTQMASSTEAAASRVEFAFKGVAVAGAALAAATVALRAVGAVVDVFGGLADSAGDAVDAYAAQESAVQGLESALALQGVNVDEAIQRHRDFASALQVATNVGDEVTLGLQRQAAMMGVADESLDQTTATAVGLSKALGITLDEALKKTVQATSGNAGALGEFIPSVRAATTEADRFAAVMEVAQRGLIAAQDATDSSAGMAARAAGAWGDFQEKIGELLDPIMRFVNEGLAVLYEELQFAIQPAINAMGSAMQALRPILDVIVQGVQHFGSIAGTAIDAALNVFRSLLNAVGLSEGTFESWGEAASGIVRWAAEQIIAGITWAEVGLSNLPAVLDLVAKSIELFAIGIVEDVKFAFTTQLPQVLSYFTGIATSWFQGIVDTSTAVMRGLTDIFLSPWRALAEIVPGVLDLIDGAMVAAGQSWGITIDAIDVQVGKMPALAQRALTDRERELMAQTSRIAGDLGREFEAKYQERIATLGIRTRESLNVDAMLSGLGPGGALASPVQVDATNALSAVESRLLVRGRSEDPLQSVADNTKATAAGIDRLIDEVAEGFRLGNLGFGGSVQLEVVN